MAKVFGFDTHDLCVKCRSCNRANKGKFCIKWSQKEWSMFPSSSDGLSSANTPMSDSSPGRSVSQPPVVSARGSTDTLTASNSIGTQPSITEESSDFSPSAGFRPSPTSVGDPHTRAERNPLFLPWTWTLQCWCQNRRISLHLIVLFPP